jgi:small neutral amino acid transporter SnatA (MarC family)
VSDFWRLALTMTAVVNPAAAALAAWPLLGAMPARDRPIAIALAGALAFGLAVICAGLADDILDWLEVAPETFRIAAGVVMAASGTYAVWRGRVAAAPGDPNWRAGVAPLGIPTLASAALLMAAVSRGADDGAGQVAGATVIAVGVAIALFFYRKEGLAAVLDGTARILGAVLVVFAIGLVVEGVRDI